MILICPLPDTLFTSYVYCVFTIQEKYKNFYIWFTKNTETLFVEYL